MSDILRLGLNPIFSFSSSSDKDKKEKPETKQCIVNGFVGTVFGYYGNQLSYDVSSDGWQPGDVVGEVDKSTTTEENPSLIALRVPVYLDLKLSENVGLSFGGTGNLDNLFSANNLTSNPFNLTEALFSGNLNVSNDYIASLSLGGFSGLSYFGFYEFWDGSLPTDDYEKLRWGGRLHNNFDFGHIFGVDPSKYDLSLNIGWEGSYLSQPTQKEFNSLAVADVAGRVGILEVEANFKWRYYSGFSIRTVLSGNENSSEGNDDSSCWVNICDGETGVGCWENTCTGEDGPPSYGNDNGDIGSGIGDGIAQTVEENLDYSGNIFEVRGGIKISPAFGETSNFSFMIMGGLSFYKEEKGWFVGGEAEIPLCHAPRLENQGEYRLGVGYSFVNNYASIFADSKNDSHNLKLSLDAGKNQLTLIGRLSTSKDEGKPPYFVGMTLTHYFEGSFFDVMQSLFH